MKNYKYLLFALMFSHWIGWVYSLCIVILIFANSLIYNTKLNPTINKDIVYISIFLIFFLIISIFFNYKSSEFFFYLYQYSSLFIIFSIFLISPKFSKENLIKIAFAFFYISSFSILIESLLVNILNISKDLMPAVRHEYAYYENYMGIHKPFGLTGQSSANGGILLISFLALYELNSAQIRHYFLLIISTILTLSGQSILTLLFVLLILFFRKKIKLFVKLVILILLILTLILVLSLINFDKLTFDYLYYVLIEEMHFIENLGNFNIIQWIFGTLGYSKSFGTEVYLIESIRCFGIFFTLSFWIFIYKISIKTQMGIVLFIALFLSSLHYPTIFYIECQIPLGLIYIYNKQKRFLNI